MKYRVAARTWNQELQLAFGDLCSVHDLSDQEVVNAIRKHGRASVGNEGEPFEDSFTFIEPGEAVLFFGNDYD